MTIATSSRPLFAEPGGQLSQSHKEAARECSRYVQMLALGRMMGLLEEEGLEIYEATLAPTQTAIPGGAFWGFGVPRRVQLSSFAGRVKTPHRLRRIISLGERLETSDRAFFAGKYDSLRMYGVTSAGVAWDVHFAGVESGAGKNRWDDQYVSIAELREILEAWAYRHGDDSSRPCPGTREDQ